MKSFKPVKCAGYEKTLHLASTDIEDVRIPVSVKPFARICMFVEGSPIESRKSMGIGGKMRRYPIENDAKVSSVTGIDESREAFGRTKSSTRRKLGERLVAPRPREGMLHDRHQFDMR